MVCPRLVALRSGAAALSTVARRIVMSMMKPEITSYSVVDLLSWQETGTLSVSPKFQRRSVWTAAAKSFFLDSVLQGYPVPPIHIRLVQEPGQKPVREVIDGQQRVRAIFDFIAGNYRISKSVSPAWGGKNYRSLTTEEQDIINLFSFTVYQYMKLNDSEVLDMFARLNTYSVSLSSQELRNGKWFGHFKQSSYRLATGALEFWRGHKIFNEQQIARMREAELVSELLIAQLDGLQDKKGSIDGFYEHLDEDWGKHPTGWHPSRSQGARQVPAEYLSASESERRFKATIRGIEEAVGDVLQRTPFRRPALFYTLYCGCYHLLYGLPRSDSLPLAESGIGGEIGDALREVAVELADVFDAKGGTSDKLLRSFYEASARQTDNIGPRSERLTSMLQLVKRKM